MQLAKALRSVQKSSDNGAHEQAQSRLEKWMQVFDNIVDGSVNYGSRRPLLDVPAWATTEVVTGGFVTGNLMAGGPLLAHELELAQALNIESTETDIRKLLNRWFLTDKGMEMLSEQLKTGRYFIDVPEEAVLLVVTVLTNNGDSDAARELLESVGGYFNKLRFYPKPSERSLSVGTDAYRWDVGTVKSSIEQRKLNRQVEIQREAVEVWAPLLDQLIQLLLQSVKADRPFKLTESNWKFAAKTVLKNIADAEREHQYCTKPHNPHSNFYQLRKLLTRFLDTGLNDKEIDRTQTLLERCIRKRGIPESAKHKAIRGAQSKQVSAPSFFNVSRIVISRLDKFAQDDGIDDIASVLQPVTKEETMPGVPVKSTIPETIARKVRRCSIDSVEKLVQSRVIPSADTLAEVLPQITGNITSVGIDDPEFRRLYASTYRAFRKRRSLLLINLAHQIQLEELPWVSAMDKFRRDDLESKDVSAQALRDIALLTLNAFPHAIVPNKMLQELRALIKAAGLDIPIVDELATDIFMGAFTSKFVTAAKIAAELLEGTLYEQYYDINYSDIRHIHATASHSRPVKEMSQTNFASLVALRAGVKAGGWDITSNGMQIEQSQILTTQNLATLTVGLNINTELSTRAADLAAECFQWICARLQANAKSRHDHLIAIKNIAYAWRQMIFFLSLLNKESQQRFMHWTDKHFEKESIEFQARFKPAVIGLRSTMQYGTAPPKNPDSGGAMLLSWTNETHWLMPES